MNAVRRICRHVRAIAPEAARTALDPLYAYKGRRVERLMLAIGYNRSGSSLLGQLRHAHPEMAVARELYLLQKLRALRFVPTPSARGRVTRLILERDREAGRASCWQSGYSYAVDGLWQGRYSRLRVIGNKAPVNSVAGLNAAWGSSALDCIRRRARLPARVLFTIRNPLRRGGVETHQQAARPRRRGHPPRRAATRRPIRSAQSVRERDVRWLLDMSESVSRALAIFPEEDVLPTRYEELVASPRENLRRVCAFLGARGRRAD